MALNDNDLLNKALDSAEEKLKADAPEPTPEVVEEAPTVEAEPAPKAEKSTKQRDPSGKFAKRSEKADVAEPEAEQVSDQLANAETIEPEAQGVSTDATPAVNAPAFWSAEQKALFAKAPRELQSVIAERELALQQHVSRVANEAERGKSYEKRFYEDFTSPEAVEKHRAEMRLQGIPDPIAELHRYRDWDRVFRSDAKAGISDLMRKNGLTPMSFMDGAEEQSNQYQDPRIDDAIARAEAAERRIQEWESKQQQTQLSTLVESFKDGKDSTGEVRRPFAEMYAPQITQAFNSLTQQYPHLTESDALNHAFEFVKEQVVSLHGIKKPATPAPAPKTREQIIADAKKAQNAATSMSGAPRTGMTVSKPRLKGKNFNEKLDSALDNAFERHAN